MTIWMKAISLPLHSKWLPNATNCGRKAPLVGGEAGPASHGGVVPPGSLSGGPYPPGTTPP